MADLLNGIPRVDPTIRPGVMRRAAGRALETKLGSAAHRRLIAPLDGPLMRLSGGRLNFAKGVLPLVVLRTTGARSGQPRDVPLGYFTDGDDVILIASNYGQAKHPAWYHNLLKNPRCELFADGRPDQGGRFVARATEGADHDWLFGLAEGYASNFKSYAALTRGVRSIPVMRLTPEPA
ncbi:nitroreductase family deazaflavin-dependent oxidoreductase [Mycolicibacterium pulveris]|uniref:Nitroreductase n=1 Tax=Mycolicibacterium pulveris TaxID=36813 RepID=A0A7I7UQ77_MYCPV|nr:nitroreductase/quinone reductase family protein [Mycolicibacterium pulveris]MCV6983763.1 nitroreductase family deazaflavin-dependent oxidoreductase [Mycolicibacterium pulveris]BBY83644.1 nitroreductase [Mycolicibacterium pulveris]